MRITPSLPGYKAFKVSHVQNPFIITHLGSRGAQCHTCTYYNSGSHIRTVNALVDQSTNMQASLCGS